MTKGYKSREMLLKEVADLKKTAEVNEKAFWKMQKERDAFRDKHADMAADIGSIRLENTELLEANRDLRQVRDSQAVQIEKLRDINSRIIGDVWEGFGVIQGVIQAQRTLIIRGDIAIDMVRNQK